jgi:hypothetical protein
VVRSVLSTVPLVCVGFLFTSGAMRLPAGVVLAMVCGVTLCVAPVARAQDSASVQMRAKVRIPARIAPGVKSTAAMVPRVDTPPTPPPTRSATPVTINRRALESLLGAQGRAIRVVRDGKPTTVTAAETTVAVRPGDFVFTKMGATAVRVTKAPVAIGTASAGTGSARFALPYRWFTLDDTAGRRVLVPYLILNGGGLTYDVARRIYRADALIGLEDSLRPTAGNEPLVKPLRLQLTTVSNGTVTPVAVALAHTGLDYVPVTVESPDSTSVRIRTGADTVGVIVPIPRRALNFTVRPVHTSIAAFGLGTTDIVLSPPPGVARSDTAMISLTGAAVSSSLVAVSGAGATVRLRSGMPGAGDSITALLDGVEVGGARVRYTFPWQFLTAALAGMLLAGAGRFFGAKRKKRASQFVRDVTFGAPAGFLVACAAAVGLDLLGLKIGEPSSWAAVLVTSALGAWAGSKVFERGGAAA